MGNCTINHAHGQANLQRLIHEYKNLTNSQKFITTKIYQYRVINYIWEVSQENKLPRIDKGPNLSKIDMLNLIMKRFLKEIIHHEFLSNQN